MSAVNSSTSALRAQALQYPAKRPAAGADEASKGTPFARLTDGAASEANGTLQRIHCGTGSAKGRMA